MRAPASAALAVENRLDFLVNVITVNHFSVAGARIAERAAALHPLPVVVAAGQLRHVVQHRLHRPLRVAAVRVVHGDAQGELTQVDAQLVQFMGCDQQMQWQLLVAQVETNDFGQEFFGIQALCQLQCALGLGCPADPVPD